MSITEGQLSVTQSKRYRPEVERFRLIVNLHLERWAERHLDALCYEQRSDVIADLRPFYQAIPSEEERYAPSPFRLSYTYVEFRETKQKDEDSGFADFTNEEVEEFIVLLEPYFHEDVG